MSQFTFSDEDGDQLKVVLDVDRVNIETARDLLILSPQQAVELGLKLIALAEEARR